MGINNNSNPEYLDFYMTADIGGWVAVGFSPSANMVYKCDAAHVLGQPFMYLAQPTYSNTCQQLIITADNVLPFPLYY